MIYMVVRLLSLIMLPNRQFAKDHHMPFWKTALFTIAGSGIDRKAKQANASYRFIFVRSDGEQLKQITKIVEKNNSEPAVDPIEFKLSDVNKALDYVANGHPKGKVVIRF